ncbi:MAG: hypothetical protein CMP59_02565 [Flavobacteriales bacterium]|nr:hypothetical protein [Flavobacteriales bacterium]|tara:strand:+ start:1303 stop:1800 length:498 start_codon:yes stop_codon:yes gene_type:complete
MNKLITTICLLFLSLGLIAQEVDIPKDLKLENAEDYKETEQLFIDGANWLLNTPVEEEANKRKEINRFLMMWMTGSPTVTIELVAGIIPAECPDCLMSFMSGWTKYSLENDYASDKIECAVAGAENAIEFYKSNKSELGKNSDMETLLKQQKKGKLKEYIESKFS